MKGSPRVRHGFAAAAAVKRPVGVADPRREGVRSVPSSSASGVFFSRPDNAFTISSVNMLNTSKKILPILSEN